MEKLNTEAILKIVQQKRKELKISQAYMAEKLGISQSSYGKIENGITELKVDYLFTMIEILDIGDIFASESSSPPPTEAPQKIENLEDLKSYLDTRLNQLENKIDQALKK